jgi:hypothetical protein
MTGSLKALLENKFEQAEASAELGRARRMTGSSL